MSAGHPAAHARVPVTRILAKDPAALAPAVFAGLWYVVIGVMIALLPSGTDPLMLAIFGTITALVTIACGAAVLHHVSFIRRTLAEGASVEGHVAGLGENSEGVGYAEVEYEHAGRPYRTRLPMQGMPGVYQPGQTVALLVDPRKPSRAIDPRRFTS